jgi:hypothetical protein
MFDPLGGVRVAPMGNAHFHFAAGFGLLPTFFGMQFVRTATHAVTLADKHGERERGREKHTRAHAHVAGMT